ncbi:unnamed protein product [Arctogadus glacialis]
MGLIECDALRRRSPSKGTRWHAADCPPDNAVDLCSSCSDCNGGRSMESSSNGIARGVVQYVRSMESSSNGTLHGVTSTSVRYHLPVKTPRRGVDGGRREERKRSKLRLRTRAVSSMPRKLHPKWYNHGRTVQDGDTLGGAPPGSHVGHPDSLLDRDYRLPARRGYHYRDPIYYPCKQMTGPDRARHAISLANPTLSPHTRPLSHAGYAPLTRGTGGRPAVCSGPTECCWWVWGGCLT